MIANHGATGAGPFQVLFTPGDGATPQSRTIDPAIDAHATVRESFIGPDLQRRRARRRSSRTPPAGSTIHNRDNNALTVTCPAPSTS